MGVCASKPADRGDDETHTKTLTPGATATISPSLQGAKSGDQDTIQDTSDNLPIAKDSYGTDEVQKPRSARVSLDARREGIASSVDDSAAEQGRLADGADGLSGSDLDDPQLLKEYTRLAEMLRYSPYPVGLIAIEEDNQPYVFVNNVSCMHTATEVIYAACRCKIEPCCTNGDADKLEFTVQVFCERLGFTDTDVVGRSWYAI